MLTSFKINTSQLDINFIDALKTLFRDKDIEINIRELDETDYLLRSEANKVELYNSLDDLKNDKVTTFTVSDFFDNYEKIVNDAKSSLH
jgi:antitoxin YefM